MRWTQRFKIFHFSCEINGKVRDNSKWLWGLLLVTKRTNRGFGLWNQVRKFGFHLEQSPEDSKARIRVFLVCSGCYSRRAMCRKDRWHWDASKEHPSTTDRKEQGGPGLDLWRSTRMFSLKSQRVTTLDKFVVHRKSTESYNHFKPFCY